MEQSLPFQAISAFPPERKGEVDHLLREAVQRNRRKIIVLDDDPTGTQAVHDVAVYTDWSLDSIRRGFDEESALFFILTNSRSFSAAQTAAVHAQIGRNLIAAARERGTDFLVVSRGDSTLRGHYPLETRVLAEAMQKAGMPVDGEVICPFFGDGGRLTVGDIHYVRTGETLVPASQTEFARDATFGYANANLRAYIAEKTQGEYPAEAVVSISLAELRRLDFDSITVKLLGLKHFAKVIVNAADAYDVKVFCIALYRALQQGKRYCYRVAASFIKALAAISDKPLLQHHEMVGAKGVGGGIVVVGSHTQKTTAQLEELLALPALQPLEMDTALVFKPGALEAEALRLAAVCDSLMQRGVTPVVYTSRTTITRKEDTAEQALLRSVQISEAVQAMVAALRVKPAFIVAKGGITSSDIGTKALGVRRAMVLGQAIPGVPVWHTGEQCRFPGIAYVIFPGNVGDTASLRDVVALLQNQPQP